MATVAAPWASAPRYADPLGRMLVSLARGLAVLGIAIIAGLAVMLVVTIVARKLLGWQVTGDHEIVRMFAAVSMSLVFPWCHMTAGNITVDLLTSALPRGTTRALDRIGSVLLGGMAALLAWRTGVLAVGSHASGAFSPLLAWPVWLFQALMVPGLTLTALCGVYVALAPGSMAARESYGAETAGE